MTVAAVVTSVLLAGSVVPTAAASLAPPAPGTTPEFSPGAARASLTASPSITVTLDDIPDAGQDIGFTTCLHGSGCSSFSLDDDADPTLTNKASAEGVPLGTYTLTQDTAPSSSTLAIACNGQVAVDNGQRQVTFEIQGSEAISCTFTNRLPGLSVRHVTQPTLTDVGQPDQPFTYHGCLGSGCAAFTLDNSSQSPYPERQSSAVAPGTYTVTQDAVPGWTVTAIACPGAVGSTPDPANRTVTVVVGAATTANCVFTVRASMLTISLDATPRTTQSFSFTGCRQGGGCADFTLDETTSGVSDTHRAVALAPGTYTVTQGATAGWDLTSLSCLGGGSTDVPNRRATVVVDATTQARCTFTNRSAAITVVQSTAGGDGQDFSFSGCAGSGCGTFRLDDDSDPTLPNKLTAAGLAPGTYTVSQVAVGAFPLTSLSCSTGESVDLAQRTVTITLAADEATTCTFSNGTPRITLRQDTVPDAPQDFTYTTCQLATGCGAVTLDDDADPTRPNQVTVTDLAPGDYRITQSDTPGYTRPSIDCGHNPNPEKVGASALLTLSRGTTCTFTNMPAGPAVSDAVQVALTERLGCVRTSASRVRCWGAEHPAGGSILAAPLTDSSAMIITDAAEVSVGGGYAQGAHGCYRTAGGEVRCWGRNQFGAVGDGSDQTRTDPVPVLAPSGSGPLTGASEISVGTLHACAVLTSGQARCWGHGGWGQLGDGTFTDRYRPVVVSNPEGTGPLTDVAHIAAGDSATCAVLTSGAVLCWGQGPLGTGSTTGPGRPQPVSNPAGTGPLTGATDVSVTAAPASSLPGGVACAVLASTRALCWGQNGGGQLGDGTTTDRTRPVPVVGTDGSGTLIGVTEVSAGTGQTCARLTSGQVRCWGLQDDGALGNGSIARATVPHPVVVLGTDATTALAGVTSLAAGWGSTCAAGQDGEAWCWGSSLYRALGTGSNYERWPYATSVLRSP